MALPAATTWEIRPTAGNDTNGGAFVTGASGTDFSQQNAKNSGGNNGSTTDAVGVGSTTLTSATASFTAAIVGNVVYLTGTGVTTGWYQVTAFSNATTVTLDRSPGTFTGATLNIGGALATIAAAYAAASTSNTFYVKASGAYTVTTTMTLTASQRNDPPMQFIGYTSTRGDNGKVTWTTATNSTPLITGGSGNPWGFVFKNFTFTNTAGTPAGCLDGGLGSQNFFFYFSNCDFSGFTSAIVGGYNNGVNYDVKYVFMDNCTVTACTSHGITTSGGLQLTACLIYTNGGDGIHVTQIQTASDFTAAVTLIRSVLYNNTGSGLNFAENLSPTGGQYTFPILINSAFVANGADGVRWFNNQTALCLQMQNCVLESNTGYALNNTGSGNTNFAIITTWNNAYRANGSGNFNGGFAAGVGDVTLTAECFTNVSGLDFSLNSTAGGGLACQSAGFPSALP